MGVTQDLSKLIRVPNSIHGETGMIAKIAEDIPSFDPWKDATLKDGPQMRIRFIEDVPEIEMDEAVGPFRKGEERELSQPRALFFMLKGSAVISAKG